MNEKNKKIKLFKLYLELGIDVWVGGYWWLTGMLKDKFDFKEQI